jgi:signal transduction histidine kinase
MALAARRSIARSAMLFWLAVDAFFKAAILPAFLPVLHADREIDRELAWTWAIGAAVVLVLAWALPLRWMMRPIARWRSLPPEQRTADVVRAASRAATVIPWRFSLLWAGQWQLLFASLLLVTRGSSLTASAVGGTLLMMATAILGPWAVGNLLFGWLLGETRARLSLEERALGLNDPPRELSLRLRLTSIAVCIAFAPFLYLACVTYVREVSTQITSASSFLITLAMFGLAVAGYAPLCAWLLARGVADPVARMADVLRQIARSGDARSVARIPRYRADEVGALADVANEMIDRLEQTATERAQFEGELEELNRTLQQRVEAAQSKLVDGQRQLMLASRRAGMSEVASAVLHNVGNALNSLNVSAQVIVDHVTMFDLAGVGKAAQLLRGDPDGRYGKLAEYLDRVHVQHDRMRQSIMEELGDLTCSVDQIKRIVARQQAHAGAKSVHESVRLDELVNEALALAAPPRQIAVEREYEALPELVVDRHRLLGILVHLLGNACEAMLAHAGVDGVLKIVVRRNESGAPRIEIHDNGIGIAAENVEKVFGYGFTTKVDGHGFGLHASANAATEAGATISCTSNGVGRGACFVVALREQVVPALVA